MILYILQGRDRQPPGHKILISTEMSCHFIHLFKNNVFDAWFYRIFFVIYVYRPGAGTESPQGTKYFNVNRKALSLYPFVASFKEISYKSDFIYIFPDLIYMYLYSPGAGAYSPPGDKVLMSTETSCPFVYMLQVSNHRRQ